MLKILDDSEFCDLVVVTDNVMVVYSDDKSYFSVS